MSKATPWPATDDEKAACWEYVLSLKEGYSLDEAEAISRAVEALKKGGKHTTEAALRGCKPKRKGPDTHTLDIGRSIKEHGVEDLQVDGRKEEPSEEEGGDKEMLKFGAEVLAMLFRKILPDQPVHWKMKRRDRSVTLPAGGRFEAVRVEGEDGEEESDFVSVRDKGVLMVKLPDGQAVPVLRGAIRIFKASGDVDRVILNATIRRLRAERNHGKYHRTRLCYSEWLPGKADWDFAFKQFVTYAGMFSPGALNYASAVTLSRWLGETRAAMSARKVKVAENYKETTGGRSKFVGMRMRKDPRLGKKRGPRNEGTTKNTKGTKL